MSVPIQLRGGIASLWASNNPTLAAREIGIETDTMLYKLGDGSTTWVNLPYSTLSGEQAVAQFVAGADPSAPSAGRQILYSKAVSGRLMPKVIGPSGLSTALQPFLARNKIGYWCPQGNSTALPGVFGYTPPTTGGSITARNVSASNLFQRMRRIGFVSTSTAGQVVSFRVAVPQITLGDGAGNGGFHKIIRFGCSDAATVAGARQFVGISNSTSVAINVEPSILTNIIGVGHGAFDSNLKMYCAGSAVQPSQTVDLGASFPANTLSTDPYELALFSPPNLNAVCYWEITNIASGAVTTGVFNGTPGTQTPAASMLLVYSWAYRSNNATALAVGLDIMSDYIETDN